MEEKDEKPLMVTIQCTAYNHEPYIRQCLEGFVMQKTNFRFEAIVHDDASTDNTAAIIKEFEAKYPDIIKPIYETENQYSKNDGSLGRIMREQTHGKYVALCEGDDYWTDPMKLQKQFDFMEGHPDYALCFHNAIVHYEEEEKEDRLFATLENREYKRRELTEKWLAPTASFFFINTVYTSDTFLKTLKIKHRIIGDFPLIISASYCGKIYGFKEIMSVYRLQKGGFMMSDFTKKHINFCFFNIELRKIFRKDLYHILSKSIGNYFVLGLSQIKKGLYLDGLILAWLAFFHAPLFSIKQMFYWFLKAKKYRI